MSGTLSFFPKVLLTFVEFTRPELTKGGSRRKTDSYSSSKVLHKNKKRLETVNIFFASIRSLKKSQMVFWTMFFFTCMFFLAGDLISLECKNFERLSPSIGYVFTKTTC